jgi:iron-sulfur cluster assembly protein
MGADTCAAPQGTPTELGMGPASVTGVPVTLSESAANHIKNFLGKRGKGLGIKLGVRTSGCSGMAYKLEFVDAEDPEDRKFESNGVTIYIDPKSLSYLAGTELDYVRDGLNEGFKFNNPNVKSACGCGESFNV